MKRSESISQLVTALAKASASFPAIERGCTARVATKAGGSYSYDYADLDDILRAVRPHLAANGLTLHHDCVVTHEPLAVETTAILMHASGEFIESSPLPIPCEGMMAPAQLIGSAATYGKRYTVQDILGLSTEKDDDGNAASGNDAHTESRAPRQPLPACPKCGKTESVIIGKPEYGGGFVCFDKKGGCKHKWQAEERKPTKGTIVDHPDEEIMANWRMVLGDKKKITNDEGVRKLNELLIDARGLEHVPTKMAVWKLMQIKAVEYNCHFDDATKSFVANRDPGQEG